MLPTTFNFFIWITDTYRGSFPGGKVAESEADHTPPSSAKVEEWVELYLHSPNMPTWRSAQLKHRENFTFTFNWHIHLMLTDWLYT
jgi:hypothetical protein